MPDKNLSVITPFKLTNIVVQPAVTRVEPPVFTAVAAASTPVQPIAQPMNKSMMVMAQPMATKVATLPLAQPELSARIENIRFIDPAFAQNIINLRTPTEGVPRDQISVPISPSENVTDELLFESPLDGSKKFYIPRYSLTQQNVSGQQRYKIALQQSGEEWTLTVHLQKIAAPAIAGAAHNASEIEHRISVILKHNQLAGGQVIGQEEIEFKEITVDGQGIQAVLRGNTLAERDLLYQTLTDTAYGATLIVRNWVTVAVPLSQRSEIIRQRNFKRAINEEASISFRRRIMPIRPLIDAEGNSLQDEANEPLFRQVERVLDNVVSPTPFIFSPSLHGYIFGGITSTSGQQFELVRHQVEWEGRWHSYYQNPVRSYQFYYLPDAFKIARRPQSPHDPMMSVRFTATDASIDNVQVTLDYIALPFVDSDRLEAAFEELKKKITDPPRPGVNGPTFEPLLNAPDKTELRLAIPRANATTGPFHEREGAMVDLRSGIHDSLSLTMRQFQSVFDALFGGSDILLNGTVVTNLGADQETIPFVARMDDLIGELFDYAEFPGDESGGLKVKLQNAIESPVRINSLRSEIRRGKVTAPGQIQKLVSLSAEQLPVEIKPGEELRLLLVPSTPLPEEGALHAVFDLSGVKVLPDKEAVWNAILDPSAPSDYIRQIKVKTFKQKFDPPRDNPDNQIMSIVLDFEDGESVELNAENLESTVQLHLPISDYILRKVNTNEYRYKARIIRLTGETRDVEWRIDNTEILFPNVK